MAAARTKLTKRMIDAAQPEARPYFLRDTEAKGLLVKVLPRQPGFDRTDRTDKSGKVFVLQYRMGRGRAFPSKRIVIDGYGAITLDQAREAAGKLWDRIRAGKDPMADREAANAAASSGLPITVADLIEEFLMRGAPAKSKAELRRSLDNDVGPVWGKRSISDIARRDVVELLDRVVDRGSPVAANRLLAAVRRMFNFAIERGIIDTSPCVKVKPPGGREKPRERNLSGEEIVALWAALPRSGMEPGLRDALRFLLVTGQRRGECLEISIDEVNPAEKTWLIPGTRTKNGKPHMVPLPALALAILADNPPDSAGYYFVSPRSGKPYHGRSLDHAVRDLFIARQRRKGKAPPAPILAGTMAPFVPHDCRRTFTTRLRELGISKDDVKRLLNHLDTSVTGRHYDHYDGLAEKRQAMAVWSSYLTKLLGLEPSNVHHLHA